ncbi:MAG: hypothetical protein ACR2IE_16175 [Candidatus Sumerlaeaceae bacterium]
MKMKLLSLFVICFSIVLLLSAPLYADDPTISQLPLAQHIHAIGNIVDPAGNTLTDVRCDIRLYGPSEQDMGQERTRTKVDGHFDVLRSKMGGLGLRFSKPGYFSSEFEISTSGGDRSSTDPLCRIWQKNVILWPKQRVPKLSKIHGLLGEGNNAKVNALVVNTTSNKYRLDWLFLTTASTELEYPYGTELRPSFGALLIVDKSSEHVSHGSLDSLHAQLRVCSNMTTDGIQIASSQPDSRFGTFPPGLDIAPADGYQNAIEIPAESFSSQPTPVSFFFRINNFYGKGVIWNGLYNSTAILPVLSVDAVIQTTSDTRELITPHGDSRQTY